MILSPHWHRRWCKINMNIIKGDNIKMLQGKDRGKTGKVLLVYPKANKVRVENLNLVKKHQKPKKQGQKGQIISIARAVNISAVQLICPKCGKATRVGHKFEGDKKMRMCKKCLSTFN